MNELTIPCMPNWYLNTILACANDGTVIYGSKKNALVVIEQSENDETPNKIKFFSNVHKHRITAIAIDENWNEKEKYFVVASENGLVQFWDYLNQKVKFHNSCHAKDKKDNEIVGVTMIDRKVVSVSMDGQVSVWCTKSNIVRQLSEHLLKKEGKITCMDTCFYESHISAVGTSIGSILIFSTLERGKVLHKLRGHNSCIYSIIFSPKLRVPSQETKNEKNIKEIEQAVDESKKISSDLIIERITNKIDEKIEEKIDSIYLVEKKEKTKILVENAVNNHLNELKDVKKNIKKNPWIDLKFPDDDEIIEDDNLIKESKPEKDFLLECQELRRELISYNDDETDSETDFKNDEEIENIVSNKNSENKDLDKLVVESQELHKENVITEIIKPMGALEINDDVSVDFNRLAKQFQENLKNKEANVIQNQITDGTFKEEETENCIENSKINVELLKLDQDNLICKNIENTLNLYSICSNQVCCWNIKNNNKSLYKKQKISRRSKSTSFFSLNWANHNSILISSCHDLMEWNLKNNKMSTIFLASTNIFNITMPRLKNYQTEELKFCWFFTMDGWLLCMKLDQTKKIIQAYPSSNWHIQSMDVSPIDPNRLALGSLSSIKLFDISKTHIKNVDMAICTNGIKGKVHKVSWNPINEYVAFCTSEGDIGLINSGNIQQSTIKFCQHPSKIIFSLCWGPYFRNQMKNQKSKKFEHQIYFCVNSKCLIYDANTPALKPLTLEISDKYKLSEVAWNPDMDLLLLGCEDGVVLVTQLGDNGDVKIIECVFDLNKLIFSIEWHPNSTAESDYSPQKNWVACTAGKQIYIYDCQSALKGENIKKITSIQDTEQIFNCKWSPHQNGWLVVAGESYIVKVWNVLTETLISTFNESNEVNLISIWSPINPNLIISSNKTSFLYIWDMAKHPTNEEKKKKNCFSSNSLPAQIINCKQFNEINVTKEILDPGEKESAFIYPKKLYDMTKLIYKDSIQISWKLLTSDMQDEELKTNLIEKLNHLNQNESTDLNNIHQIFTESENIQQIINSKIEEKELIGDWGTVCRYYLVTGDICGLVNKAIETKRLNSWILSIAASASFNLWQKATLEYADYLKDNGLYAKASDYYLALHKIEEAVEMLCKSGKFFDAFILARTRLLPNDPIHQTIIKQWILFCEKNGICKPLPPLYIILKDYYKAAKWLLKNPTVESFELALHLAKLMKHQDLINHIEQLLNVENKKKIGSDQNVTEKGLLTKAEVFANEIKFNEENEQREEIVNGVKFEEKDVESCENLLLE